MTLLLLLGPSSESPFDPYAPLAIDYSGDRFLETIASSHRVAIEVTVLTTDGDEVPLEVADGSVTLDGTAAVRGRCELTVANPLLVPSSPASLLAPYGNELRIKRGVVYPDGTTELVALGIFGIRSARPQSDEDGTTVLVTGLDRSQRTADNPFDAPYQVPAGTLYTDAILAIVQLDYPTVAYDFATIPATTPLLSAAEEDDKWDFAQQLASAIACVLYYDGDGVLILAPAPTSVSGPSVWEVAEGENGVLLNVENEWTREGTANRVIAIGENVNETTAVRGEALDDNPRSPTYYYGPFGRVTTFYHSDMLTDAGQCAQVAAWQLALMLGTTKNLSFGSLVNPRLAPFDIVRVRRHAAGIDEDHVIDSISIPLAASESMQAATRAAQVLS